jgi:hypothetical protein
MIKLKDLLSEKLTDADIKVGGLAYYIGYHQGEEHFNGGIMKRRPYFGDRK